MHTQIDRPLVELSLICRAASLTNLQLKIKLILVPNNIRAQKLVEKGIADLSSDSVWLSEANQLDVHVSVPVFENGEFEKGLYVLDNSEFIDRSMTKNEISNLRGLGLEFWVKDWIELQKITSKVVKTKNQNSLYNMLKYDRADFVLFEFSTSPNMELCEYGICLQPIKNVKVILPDSRHFIMSNKSKKSRKLFESIDTGLKFMRDKGEIKQMYLDSGHINPEVQDWQVIN